MSIAVKTIKSSAFVLLFKLLHRSVGLISFLILARLLTPEDFGVVAIATMLVYLCNSIAANGGEQYIIQKKEVSTDDINTAWTVNLIMKSIAMLILIALARPISTFFDMPELENVIPIIALLLPLLAIPSPGIYLLKKELNYKPLLHVEITDRTISFIVVIILALTIKSYWALIISLIFSNIGRIIASYIIAPHRVKLTLSNLREQWEFSQWIMFKSTIGYLKSEFDTIFIGKNFTAAGVGGFAIMKNLSTMPGREIIAPLSEPLLPALASDKENQKGFNYKVLTSITILLTATTPMFTYLYLFHNEIVSFLLGDKWLLYAPILGLLAFYIIDFSIVSTLQQALIALGKVRLSFYFELFSFSTIIMVLLSINHDSVYDFTQIRITLAILTMFSIMCITFTIFKINPLNFVTLFTPIFIANIFAGYLSFHTANSFNSLIIKLISSGVVFLVTYTIILISINLLLKNVTINKDYIFMISQNIKISNYRK